MSDHSDGVLFLIGPRGLGANPEVCLLSSFWPSIMYSTRLNQDLIENSVETILIPSVHFQAMVNEGGSLFFQRQF